MFKETAWDIEIKMIIPFNELANYRNDDDDEYDIEPTFVRIMELLNVEFDVGRIIEKLYTCRRSDGAVEVHYSLDSFDEFIILDTYLGLTDQLDFINIMFRGKASKGGELRNLTHKFYIDKCKYNVHYEEGNHTITNSTKLDFTRPDELYSNDIKKVMEEKKIILFRKDKILKEYNTI